MFKLLRNRKADQTPRSLTELRKQLQVLDADRRAEIKGGQGIKRTPPALKACGGWMPQ